MRRRGGVFHGEFDGERYDPLEDTHHDPPLRTCEVCGREHMLTISTEQGCGDCHYPFEGTEIVKCEVHK